MLTHAEIERFVRVASWLPQKGWAEANAGNMSVRLDRNEPFPARGGELFHVKHFFPSLVGERFLITGTGRRMRDIAGDPEKNIGIVEIMDGGSSYRCLWGCGVVTSEFPSHLAIHAMCIARRSDMRAILHTHPPHLTAMSHLPNMAEPDAINQALRHTHPETFILLPQGTVTLDYAIPGSMELGNATADALRTRDTALWGKHGIVSLATDLEVAFDHVEVLEKSAQIYLMAAWAGKKPAGLSDEQIEITKQVLGL